MSSNLQNIAGVLIDVDKTLTNTQRKITPRTKQVLGKLIKKNIPTSLCTGRCYAMLKNYVMPLFPNSDNHIVSGGGQIVTSSGKIIWEKLMPSELVKMVSQEVESLGSFFGFGAGDRFYANDGFLNKLKNHPWKIMTSSTKHLENWQTPLLTIINLNTRSIKFLSTQKKLSVKIMSGYDKKKYADITFENVNKATSAKMWADNLGIDLSKVIAIGDSINDLEVLKVVGHPVAMSNAVDEIKQIADEVIGHTDEDGLAKYLEQFIN